jgi:hypothetical protein
MRIYAKHELQWHGNKLCLGKHAIISIAKDEKYPTMWRIRWPDGRLSDMVNLTRVRDAARSAALSILNGSRNQAGEAARALES